MKVLHSLKQLMLSSVVILLGGALCVSAGNPLTLIPWLNDSQGQEAADDTKPDLDHLPARGELADWMVEEAGPLVGQPESVRKPKDMPGIAPMVPPDHVVAPSDSKLGNRSRASRLRQGKG